MVIRSAACWKSVLTKIAGDFFKSFPIDTVWNRRVVEGRTNWQVSLDFRCYILFLHSTVVIGLPTFTTVIVYKSWIAGLSKPSPSTSTLCTSSPPLHPLLSPPPFYHLYRWRFYIHVQLQSQISSPCSSSSSCSSCRCSSLSLSLFKSSVVILITKECMQLFLYLVWPSSGSAQDKGHRDSSTLKPKSSLFEKTYPVA